MDWLSYVWPSLASLLVGGGGVAWYSAIKQGRQGDRAVDISASDSGRQHWEAMLKTQVEVIVNPLKDQVVSLTARVATLEAEKTDMVTRFETSRKAWEDKERLHWKYEDDLVDHILLQKNPPPPPKPEGL